jgi:hypothetical protein
MFNVPAGRALYKYDTLQSAARGTYADSDVFTDSPLGTAARAVVRLVLQ